ncbi:MAG: hypothetical protein GXP39_09890 [Chloroflexi bacterium]|nr:hypothetical protein [Chloroflexota bacterium]
MSRLRLLVFLILLALLLVPVGGQMARAQDAVPVVEEPGVLDEGASAGLFDAATAVSAVSSAFSGGPSYDSGWVPLFPGSGRTLFHNLGGDVDDYVVVMDYKADDINGINQRYYGGVDFGTKPAPGASANDRVGAYWRSLTNATIVVYRRPEDRYADWVRIRIWVDPNPSYDSGWIGLTPGASATTLNHGVGGNTDDYVVDMQYRSSGSGVNQRYYGGMDFGSKAFKGTRNNDRVGVYWRSLTDSTITLFRRAEDNYASQVRVRIWKRPRPTYDSGWVGLNRNQAKTLIHSIGGDPNDYVVDMQYRSGGNGVNQRYYGGADFGTSPAPGASANDRVGAYWRSLTYATITVYRRSEDLYASEVRVRIWRYWRPRTPDYDSGWIGLSAGSSARTLIHNLGGDADTYLVDAWYRASDSNGINLRYYGGADFGTKPAPGHSAEDRVGAYWRSLTDSTITLFRRAEDSYARWMRVRIWKMPKPDYDSGWVSLSQGQAKTLSHSLGGSTNDYLVDMQYRNGSSGVNQRYYGGADFGTKPAPGTSANDRVGAYWRTLTTSSVTVYRRPDDVYASEVRVRIWRIARPDYDSGWVILNQNQARALAHGLGGSVGTYFLTMWQGDIGFNGVNQRHLGGADFGTSPPSGYGENNRVGAYWRTLTDSSVTIYRRPEDGLADRVRVRIWDYGKRVYMPSVMK